MNKIQYTAHHLPISENMKMADVIHLDYLLIPIIGRFGIEFGFGNKTVKEICEKRMINCSFFVEILNSYHNSDYFPAESFNNYHITLIIEYLSNTHRYYLNFKLPELEKKVNEFILSSSKENENNNKLIASFFDKYKQELIKHLNQEDNNVFPYSKELSDAVFSGEISTNLLSKINGNFLAKNNDDHNELEEKLDDLKNLIIKFLPPVKRKDLLETILIELFRMEDDLNDHARIEDKVLLPKIYQLEQKILEISDTQKK